MSKVVLVVGAGAGRSFSCPTGVQLIVKIADVLSYRFDDGDAEPVAGDRVIYRQLRRGFREQTGTYLEAARAISAGISSFRSVDDYLYSRGESEPIVLVGKMAVVSSILEAERASGLAKLSHPDPGQRRAALRSADGTWLAKLFSLLTPGVRQGDVVRLFEGLAFINFNYDRCVEQYLFHAIQHAFDVPAKVAAEAMAALTIIHPYGRLGALPWEDADGAKVEFGQNAETVPLIELARGIYTFTEQREDQAEREAIEHLLGPAGQTLFLGFGFHKQNMEILKLSTAHERARKVVATVLGTSGEDRQVFVSRINQSLRRGQHYSDPILVDGTCEALIDRFGLLIWSA